MFSLVVTLSACGGGGGNNAAVSGAGDVTDDPDSKKVVTDDPETTSDPETVTLQTNEVNVPGLKEVVERKSDPVSFALSVLPKIAVIGESFEDTQREVMMHFLCSPLSVFCESFSNSISLLIDLSSFSNKAEGFNELASNLQEQRVLILYDASESILSTVLPHMSSTYGDMCDGDVGYETNIERNYLDNVVLVIPTGNVRGENFTITRGLSDCTKRLLLGIETEGRLVQVGGYGESESFADSYKRIYRKYASAEGCTKTAPACVLTPFNIAFTNSEGERSIYGTIGGSLVVGVSLAVINVERGYAGRRLVESLLGSSYDTTETTIYQTNSDNPVIFNLKAVFGVPDDRGEQTILNENPSDVLFYGSAVSYGTPVPLW